MRATALIAVAAALYAVSTPPRNADPVLFENVAARAGIGFVLRNSATPERHQIETMVSGIAVLDYNGDGRPDIYFVNGAPQPALVKDSPQWWNRLYRNDGDWKFTDVTEQAGVRGEGFGTGAAAADFDSDGRTDLFVTAVGRTILYRNRGDGTFEDVTRSAGVEARQPWPISAGWFDYDRDGRPDLFVVNYVMWRPESEPFCGDIQRNLRAYCHPKYYQGLPNTLFRNNGNGTFTDVSRESGILAHVGKGMAVNFADYDQDGDLDAFVTNDTVPNFLFRNDGGKFSEVALEAGVAFSEDGRALSSMGADFRDVDNDGREDIFVTALMNETFPLFRNLGGGLFQDITNVSGVGKTAFAYSGWSTGMYDFNNDGWKDLFVAAGDVNDNAEQFSSRASRQRNLVFVNLGAGRFAAQTLDSEGLHRGAAFADFDRDGRVDVVVSRIGEPAELWRNISPARNHWLAVRLNGYARIRVGSQWNHPAASVGYACSSDSTVHFGLGADASRQKIEILWPNGRRQSIESDVDRYVNVP